MSNTKELKEYLLEKEGAFLVNEENNGKTIMLSGAWGAGKTHFWQSEISPTLTDELKENDKANIYISLYGKESIAEIKFEILKEAYNAIVDEDIISKGASFFSSIAPSFGEKSLAHGFDKLNQTSKDEKSKEILKDGSIICLDDFERKSKKIDLNDLFGLISYLALTHNCKVVIILNSDVFTGKEAEVFKNVKEKTVNKFFYFEPTIEELFKSISKDKKYDNLKEYKDVILKAVSETEELNARIYIQVLDNCLEWLKVKENLDENILRVLVLGTFNFVLNHMILDFQEIILSKRNNNFDPFNTLPSTTREYTYIHYRIITSYEKTIKDSFVLVSISDNEFKNVCDEVNEEYEIEKLINEITKQNGKDSGLSIPRQEELLKWIKENQSELKALWKYGYRLYHVADVDEKTYNKIAKFIKSGILI